MPSRPMRIQPCMTEWLIVHGTIYEPNPMVRLFGKDPEGRKCRECHFVSCLRYHDKDYWKCSLRKLTHGAGSDHRLKWNACKRFEKGDGT